MNVLKKDIVKKNNLNAKYKIELTENQIDALIQICEAYTRIAMHQMHFVLDQIIEIPTDQIEKMKHLCNQINSLSPKNKIYDTSLHEINDTAKIAYDMFQQLRYKVAWDRNPDGGSTVDFSPTLKTSKEKLIKIDRISPFDDGRQITVPKKDGKYFVWSIDKPELSKNKIEIKTLNGERWLTNLEFDANVKLSKFKENFYWKEISE